MAEAYISFVRIAFPLLYLFLLPLLPVVHSACADFSNLELSCPKFSLSASSLSRSRHFLLPPSSHQPLSPLAFQISTASFALLPTFLPKPPPVTDEFFLPKMKAGAAGPDAEASSTRVLLHPTRIGWCLDRSSFASSFCYLFIVFLDLSKRSCDSCLLVTDSGIQSHSDHF